jgi:hypothetical protein
VEHPFKLAKDRDSSAHSQFVPSGLSGASPSHCSLNVPLRGTFKFAQCLPGRGIHRDHFASHDLKIGNHIP